MTTKIIVAAALALLVAGGAVADASAATITKTRTPTATHAIRPVVAKTVKIVHRVHRPHLAAVRAVPGHRLSPRIHLAHAFTGKRIVKTTVVR